MALYQDDDQTDSTGSAAIRMARRVSRAISGSDPAYDPDRAVNFPPSALDQTPEELPQPIAAQLSPAVSALPSTNMSATAQALPQNPTPTPAQRLPFLRALTAQNPNTGMTYSPLSNPYMTKGQKLLGTLIGLGEGAAAGAGQMNFGAGFQAAQQLPFIRAIYGQQVRRGQLENRITQQQIQMLQQPITFADGTTMPLAQAMQLGKFQAQQAGIDKDFAEAQKNRAEAGGQQYQNALHEAQAAAARYKEVNGILYDVSGAQPQPVQSAGQFVPADQQMASVANVPLGTQLPIATAQKLKSMANEGITTTQANGRSLLIDKTGRVISDLGAATPLMVMDRQLSPGTVTPDMQSKVDAVGQGKMDLATALRTYYRYPGMADAFTSALYQKYPDFNQATYGVSKDTLKYFTTGAGATQLTAFRTAIAHADLLQQAAQALNNGDNRTFNSITNRLESEFGDKRLTTFQAIANAYNHEVSQVVAKGHITDSEVKAGGATMPSNANYQTIQSVTNAYKQLMQSKADNLFTQYDQGRKGQPAFPAGTATNGNKGDYWSQFPIH